MIAELSANHGGSLQQVFKLIDAGAEAGANAIKLQTYTADTMTIDHNGPGFVIDDPKSLWHGRSLYSLYSEGSLPWEWHKDIFSYCQSKGLVCFSTPFDESAVEFLEGLGSKLYKVASFEVTDIPLLEAIGRTEKPVIMSTGMASLEEIRGALTALHQNGCPNVVLLKCTSAYPAPLEDINLRAIQTLADEFHCMVGLSDHSLGIGVSLGAVALGARVIERHFTLDRNNPTLDSAFSLEPSEFTALSAEANKIWQALGRPELGCARAEEASRAYRRSIYAIRDIAAGEIFGSDNVRVIRPGFGAPPELMENLLGRRASRKLPFGTPICPSDAVPAISPWDA
jgi:N-acetylneuraminate synthase